MPLPRPLSHKFMQVQQHAARIQLSMFENDTAQAAASQKAYDKRSAELHGLIEGAKAGDPRGHAYILRWGLDAGVGG